MASKYYVVRHSQPGKRWTALPLLLISLLICAAAPPEKAQPSATADNQLASALDRVALELRGLRHAPMNVDAELREKQDLLAQQRMALWAFWMFVASAISCGVAAATLVFVWRTVHHARRSADFAAQMAEEARKATKFSEQSVAEAQKATRFSEQAADTAREALIATDRAWLQVDVKLYGPLTISDEKLEIPLHVELANVGRSPATQIVLDWGLFPSPIEATAFVRRRIEAHGSSLLHEGSLLFPGQSFADQPLADLDAHTFRQTIADRLESALFDNPAALPSGVPVLVVGAIYHLPGDKKRRHTYRSFLVLSRAGPFDGATGKFEPGEIVLQPSWDQGRVT